MPDESPIQPPNAIGFDALVQQDAVPPGAMVPTAPGVVATEDDAPAEMSTRFRKWTAKPVFTEEDISYPRLRLAQGTTPEVQQGNAQIGDLVLTAADPVKSAVLIPMMEAKCRELHDKENIKKVLCQSIDAITGEGTPGGACKLCPLSQWSGGENGSPRKAPPCDLIYSYVCFSTTHNQIVVFELKRTGTNQAKFINTMIERRGMGRFGILVSHQKKTNPKGQGYAEPVIVPAKIDDTQFQEAAEALL